MFCGDNEEERAVVEWIDKKEVDAYVQGELQYITDLEAQLECDQKSASAIRSEISSRRRRYEHIMSLHASHAADGPLRVREVGYDRLAKYMVETSPLQHIISRVVIYIKSPILREFTLIDTPGLPSVDLKKSNAKAAFENKEVRERRERIAVDAISNATGWIYLMAEATTKDDMRDRLKVDVARLTDGAASTGLILLTQADVMRMSVQSDTPLLEEERLPCNTECSAAAVVPTTCFFASVVHPHISTVDVMDKGRKIDLNARQLAAMADMWLKRLRGRSLVGLEDKAERDDDDIFADSNRESSEKRSAQRINLLEGIRACFAGDSAVHARKRVYADAVLEMSVLPAALQAIKQVVVPQAVARGRADAISGVLRKCKEQYTHARSVAGNLTAEQSGSAQMTARLDKLRGEVRDAEKALRLVAAEITGKEADKAAAEHAVQKSSLVVLADALASEKKVLLRKFEQACNERAESAKNAAVLEYKSKRGLLISHLDVSVWDEFDLPISNGNVKLLDNCTVVADVASRCSSSELKDFLSSARAKQAIASSKPSGSVMRSGLSQHFVLYKENLFQSKASAEREFQARFERSIKGHRATLRSNFAAAIDAYFKAIMTVALKLRTEMKDAVKVLRDDMNEFAANCAKNRRADVITAELLWWTNEANAWRDAYFTVHAQGAHVVYDATLSM